MGFILFLIAQIFSPLFNFIGVIYAISKLRNIKEIAEYFGKLAYSKDQYANVVNQHLFNDAMIKKESENKFGNPDETISSVFGKNQRTGKLRIFGYFWGVRFLSKLEKDHSIKSIEDDE